MERIPSLDDLIARKAVQFADQLRGMARTASKEEEIRIEAERQLAFIEKEAGVKLEGKHEFTVASGRVDSVYQRVIIEYKNPSSPSDRIGPRPDSPGTKKVVEQIKKRFYDMRSQHSQPLNSLFGVGLDGKHFVFVRFREDKWQVQDPVEVNKVSSERFLWALFNLGQKGKPFSPEYLAGDFGSEGPLAQAGIHALYGAIATATHPKALVFFNQWKILFGEVCGYEVDNPSDKIKKLADFYGVPVKGLKPAELLFAVHTYYALFMKLLASEIVGFFHRLPRPLQSMMAAVTGAKLKREMEELEAGSIFRHLNITNFLEGDLFAWYIPVWAGPVEKVVRDMVVKLDQYNPGTLSEDPPTSRDLLKRLYQQLFPKTVRRSMGEYYTPDWLAEHVLNEVGYAGDPDKRLLDPACGSGTFLVMAINRIRAWYDQNREKCAFGEDDLCRKILANVIGFDLNPLAVMAARTNYLIAIRDLIGQVDKVEIPVYLCDSILTPSTYGGLFAGTTSTAKELKTAAANFIIPTEIATNRDDVAKYADQLEFCVSNGYSPKEFVERCQEEGLRVSAEDLHTELYKELVRLDKESKNGVWARIIKNAFAPLFVGMSVDFAVGNPPWIRWQYLPKHYRDTTKALWHRYGLFSLSGHEARLGPGEKDFSQLFTYACIDSYLKQRGKLGFVITQSVFRSKGQASGFRRFRLGDREPFAIDHVDDFSQVKPFEAANLTCTFVATKGNPINYPVRYSEWVRRKGLAFDSHQDLKATIGRLERAEYEAEPTDHDDPTSQWRIVSSKARVAQAKLYGTPSYQAHQGVRTDPYGVYWVEILETRPKAQAFIRNMADAGKTELPEVKALVELRHIYPAIKGRNVRRWHIVEPFHIIMVQDPEKRVGIQESELRRLSPLTFGFLNKFRQHLLAVASRVVSGLRTNGPFYSMYGVGPYTLAEWKVVWPMMGNTFRTSVVSSLPVIEGVMRPVIPCTNTITFLTAEDEDEAHYISALLNSTPCRLYIESISAAGRGFGTPAILDTIALPKFSKKDEIHRELSRLSQSCHRAASHGDHADLARLEMDVDGVAARLWGISAVELEMMQTDSA